MQDVRIASVIFQAPINNIKQNLQRMEKWVSEARMQGTEIICFPEMNITGYSTRVDVCSTPQCDADEILKSVQKMAQGYEIAILCGYAESSATGKLYAAHAFVPPKGEVGVYRKLFLAPPEQEIFTKANQIPIFEYLDIKFGIQLCYDAHFPELSARMAIKGVDIIFIPHASPRGTPEEKFRSWMRHLPARAYDNSLFVVALNQTGSNGAGLVFPGLAVFLDPSGDIIHKDTSGNEGLVIAELTSDQLDRVRGHRMRYFLPNRREDLFPL